MTERDKGWLACLKWYEFDPQHRLRTAIIGFIWFATAVDIYCLQWLHTEWNPLAKLIIDTCDIWTFIGVKVFTTWVATEWLRRLPLWYSWIVAGAMGLLLLRLVW